MPPHVPQVLINLDDIPPPKDISEGFDVRLLGRCDDVMEFLRSVLQWEISVGNKTPVVAPSGSGGRSMACQSVDDDDLNPTVHSENREIPLPSKNTQCCQQQERAISVGVDGLMLPAVKRSSSAPLLTTQRPSAANGRTLRKRMMPTSSAHVLTTASDVGDSGFTMQSKLMTPVSSLLEVKCRKEGDRVYNFKRLPFTTSSQFSTSTAGGSRGGCMVVAMKKRGRPKQMDSCDDSEVVISRRNDDGRRVVNTQGNIWTAGDVRKIMREQQEEETREILKRQREKRSEKNKVKPGGRGVNVMNTKGSNRKRKDETDEGCSSTSNIDEHQVTAVDVKREDIASSSSSSGRTKRARTSKYASSGDYECY
jgi:hypothetical protein